MLRIIITNTKRQVSGPKCLFLSSKSMQTTGCEGQIHHADVAGISTPVPTLAIANIHLLGYEALRLSAAWRVGERTCVRAQDPASGSAQRMAAGEQRITSEVCYISHNTPMDRPESSAHELQLSRRVTRNGNLSQGLCGDGSGSIS